MKQTEVKARRKFDDTFKREAVQNWLSSGQSAEKIGPELGGSTPTSFTPGESALPPPPLTTAGTARGRDIPIEKLFVSPA